MADDTDGRNKSSETSRKKLIRQRGEIINWMTEIEAELDDIIISVYIKPEFELVFLSSLLWEDFRLSTKIKFFEAIPISLDGKKFQNKVAKQLWRLASVRNKFAHRLSLINSDGTYLIDKGHQAFQVTDERLEEFRQEARYALAALKAVSAALTDHTSESIQKGELTLISVEELTEAIKAKIKNNPDQLLFSTKSLSSNCEYVFVSMIRLEVNYDLQYNMQESRKFQNYLVKNVLLIPFIKARFPLLCIACHFLQ